MLEIESGICSKFEPSSSREWLEANGIGGYASSSISGANTRRYHALLVASTRPPLGRVALLSKFEETLIVAGERFDLSCNQYVGSVYPDGFKYLKSFRLDPFPIWRYEAGGVVVERSIFMVHGENTSVIQWKLKGRSKKKSVKLEIRPLLAFRDHHHLRHEDSHFETEYRVSDGRVALRPYAEMPELLFAHNAETVEEQGFWYRNFEYAIERERGFDHTEDLYQPFGLTFDLARDAFAAATTESEFSTSITDLERAEIKRRADIVVRSEIEDKSQWPRVLAADQFIVKRGTGKSVIAGYHWFSDWGRDTMIALTGLTLATRRPEIALSVLTEFSNHISEGMLPNRFPDAGETPDYNTVDATLWYFEAIRAYAEYTGDYDAIKSGFYDKLADIIDWHVRGTRYGIRVDTDGLLHAGEAGTQLTWMDAKIGDRVITPRIGKPVEIQALWYNALCIMSDLAIRFGDDRQQGKYSEMDEVARNAFNGQFWNESDECLFDVVHDLAKDASIRPNQIFAVSLPHTMLDADKARKVVKKVESELLTPFGLRSLSPNDPSYIGIYTGSPLNRDAAYHQGTVWGWLIGPFVDAYRKVHSKDAKAEKRIVEILAGFRSHMADGCVGQISEIFDGDAPHLPRGAAAQAWSVAELLRISVTATEGK